MNNNIDNTLFIDIKFCLLLIVLLIFSFMNELYSQNISINTSMSNTVLKLKNIKKITFEKDYSVIDVLGSTTQFNYIDNLTFKFYDSTYVINSININDITIYPNPVFDKLYIQSSNQKLEDLIILICTIEGKVLLIHNVSFLQSKLSFVDMSNLHKGVYFCNLKYKELRRVFKFIKL